MTASLSTTELTPLERDLLQRYHARYQEMGFPAPHEITVTSRTSSTAGRYVYLAHQGLVRQADGQLGLGIYSQFDLEGLDAGASFHVEIENGKVLHLEIDVNGFGPWDGSERNWIVRDPDTGG